MSAGTSSPKRSVRWRLAIALFLLLAGLFILLLLGERWAEFRRLEAEIREFHWDVRAGWLAAALLLATANLFWMAKIWVRLFRATGGVIRGGEGVRVWVITNMGRYIPGKLWQLGGLALYMRRTGRSGTAALFSSLAFQILVVGTGIAVGLSVLGLRFELLPAGSGAGVAILAAALLALLHPAVLQRATGAAARWMREDVAVKRLGGRELAAAGASLLAAWALYGLGLWCLLRGLTGDAQAAPQTLTGIFAAAYVAGYVVLVAPGGLVVREGALAGLLAALTPLSLGVAAAVAVLARIWVVASELLALALVALPVDRRRPTEGPSPGLGRG
ncbi:MAG: lysylphosphatidylglycerol synthase domain-containing protein [Gemmatimonadota bacterium]